MSELSKFLLLVAAFLVFYFVPWGQDLAQSAIVAGLVLLGEYAREHTLTCLVPAFFIAGGMAVFVKKDAVLRYLGPKARKYLAYPVAASAGGVLAVCSCTILPLFAGIYTRGAGIGPAAAFLFAGPSINVTAVFLTGTVLGWDLSIARIIASFFIAIVTGLIMAALFRRQDEERTGFLVGDADQARMSTGVLLLFFGLQVANLVVLGLKISPVVKWSVAALLLGGLALIATTKLVSDDRRSWVHETWCFTKQILPLLFVGVFAAGLLGELLPQSTVQALVGGNRASSNFVASIFGALMYFATLTEVPIIQKLMGLGMGKGPALALFLSGYSLSIPNIIVLNRLMGTKQAFTYIGLIVGMSAVAGMIFGLV